MSTVSEFAPRKAVKRAQSLKLGILGLENAGKTLSAIKMARGIAGPAGSIVAIDTHNGQVEEYVGHDGVGQFQVIDVRPPFRPDRILSAFKAACDAGADVIVIDSMSHEWDGDGGVVDWVGEIESDLERRNKKTGVGVWKKPKMAHKRLVSHMMGVTQHVIFCLRLKHTTDTTGKKSVDLAGDNHLLYDLTAHYALDRDTHLVSDVRVNDRYAGIVPQGALIENAHGAGLAKEAARGVETPHQAEIAALEDAARHGTTFLRAVCESVKSENNVTFATLKARPGFMDRLGELAAEADAKSGVSSATYAPAQLDISDPDTPDDPVQSFDDDWNPTTQSNANAA